LHGVERNLVAENLALLVGDRLPIYGEGVLRVIPEAVKESIGIGRHAGVESVTRELIPEDSLSNGSLVNRSRSTSV